MILCDLFYIYIICIFYDYDCYFFVIIDKYFIYIWVESLMNFYMKIYGIKFFFNCFKINLVRNWCIYVSFFFYCVKNIWYLVWLLWSWKCYYYFGVNWILLMFFWCCFVREYFIFIIYYNFIWILNLVYLVKGYNI